MELSKHFINRILEHCFPKAERKNKTKSGTAPRCENKSGVSQNELDIFQSSQNLTTGKMTHHGTTG